MERFSIQANMDLLMESDINSDLNKGINKKRPLLSQIKDVFTIYATSILFSAFLMLSCECVPNLDTPKVIEPKETAKLLFIHSLPDYGLIDIKTTFNEFKGLDYNEVILSYRPIATEDIITVSTLSDGFNSVVYRQPIGLKKDMLYTYILYGSKNRIREILINDTTSESPDKAKLRFINTGINSSNVKFYINGNPISSTIPYGAHTELYNQPSGLYTFEARNSTNDSLLAASGGNEINSGSLYLILLKGYSGIGSRPMRIFVIRANP